jgi:amino acid transporter
MRLLVFFILGALSVGVLVPYTDASLLATAAARPGAGTSPYVIAMERLRLGGLAHVVNALVMLSIFSAGNSYVYTSSRILFGLALEGRVPRILSVCNTRGVPVYCVCVAMLFSLLAFLQLGNASSVVLQWCVSPVFFLIFYQDSGLDEGSLDSQPRRGWQTML